MKFFLVGVLFIVSYVHGANLRIDPLVLINQGLVRGQKAMDGDYTMFLGIPYAVVDEDNPFGAALQHKAFEEQVYKAYDGSFKCPQTNPLSAVSAETLDCLRLNIYVPNDATSKNPFPVMVWIHGGQFEVGSAGDYGVRTLVNQGIVVVTINYRLGPYGFMCLDTPLLSGNQGLKDQYVALRWVKNNIGSFGGNPYNVTLAGQNAGASSALLHLYSSKEKYFHKVIVESGTPQTEGLFVNGDAKAAIKLAKYLGLNTTDNEEAIKFLSKTPFNLVTAATTALDMKFRPCKERSYSGVDNFVESDPYFLSNEKKVRDTPILIGHTSKEKMDTIEQTYGSDYFNDDPFYKKIASNYNLKEETLIKVSNTIRHFYIGDKGISKDVVSEFEDFESDFVFNHPMQRTISSLLNENAKPVYEYVFNYVGDSGKAAAGHSAELKYLFEMTDNFYRSEDEQLVVDQITTLWANFVKYGNPTPNKAQQVTWTALSSDTRPYMVIDKNLRMESRVLNERMAFWDMFHDNYGSYNKLARECLIRTDKQV